MGDGLSWRAELEQLAQQEEGSTQPQAEDRAFLLRGLTAMQEGDIKEATTCFRRAQRKDTQPYASIAGVALGECLRLDRKEGAAIKTWRAVERDPNAPASSRYGALLGIAKLLEERGDEPRELERTLQEIDTLAASLQNDLPG